jgi:hypothetical protein
MESAARDKQTNLAASEADIRDVIAPMRLNYNRLAKAESPTTAAQVQR